MAKKLLAEWHSLSIDESGASLVEYAFLIVLIALVAIAAVELLGNQVDSGFNEFSSEYGDARPGGGGGGDGARRSFR